MAGSPTVCVTGAGGYIASWLVKLLLARGYSVHGTVRDLSDKKTAHLKRLENATENLRLFKADLLDYDAMAAATVGCHGVFHVATQVPSEKLTDPELQMLAPAVTGTTNVLRGASAANVQRMVVVSSIVAVKINPKGWPEGKIRDENCWSDEEFCRSIESWYPVAKIISEKAALAYGHRTGLDVVTVNPGLVFGPLLQPIVNASSQFLIYLLKGSFAIGGPCAAYLQSFQDLWTLPLFDNLPAKVVSGLISAVTWNIWKSRNALVFQATIHPTVATLRAMAADILLWAHRIRHLPHRHIFQSWSQKLCNMTYCSSFRSHC